MLRSFSLLRQTTEKIFSHFKFLVFVFFQNATADFITNCDGLLLQSATEQRFNQVELPKYGYIHVGTEKTYMELWSFPVL